MGMGMAARGCQWTNHRKLRHCVCVCEVVWGGVGRGELTVCSGHCVKMIVTLFVVMSVCGEGGHSV